MSGADLPGVVLPGADGWTCTTRYAGGRSGKRNHQREHRLRLGRFELCVDDHPDEPSVEWWINYDGDALADEIGKVDRASESPAALIDVAKALATSAARAAGIAVPTRYSVEARAPRESAPIEAWTSAGERLALLDPGRFARILASVLELLDVEAADPITRLRRAGAALLAKSPAKMIEALVLLEQAAAEPAPAPAAKTPRARPGKRP